LFYGFNLRSICNECCNYETQDRYLHQMKMKVPIFIPVIIIGYLVCLNASPAGARKTVNVVVNKNISLRGLAETYLGHPDEWQTILYYNGLSHLDDMEAGMALIIPVDEFKETMACVDQAASAARLANMEGAGVLAAKIIGESEQLIQKAIALKKKGKLAEATAAARQAALAAKQALATARQKANRNISAVLSQKVGHVQSRKPAQPLWAEALIHHELIEKERIRTLSASRASLLFVDKSLIHMDENSLAVIGEMKENLINKNFKAKVTVLQGDVLVHLSAFGDRNEFAVNAPDIDTAIRSMKFRTSRDKSQVTRIANYDGEIDVRANRGMVTVKKDEGTKIETGRKPATPRKLLGPPAMRSPIPKQVIFSSRVVFEWEEVEDAGAYKLEIASDRHFATLVTAVRSNDTRYEWKVPQKGTYYCRIHTIDDDDFSGPFSATMEFLTDIDTQPPFLTVYSPANDGQIVTADIIVKGLTEHHAKVFINGEAVKTAPTGEFKHRLALPLGKQTIRIVAKDRAENQSRIDRKVIHQPKQQFIELDGPDPLIANVHQVTLKGRIQPDVTVTIDDKPVALPCEFSHVLTLAEGRHTLSIKATSASGAVHILPVHIWVDTTSPEIQVKNFADPTTLAALKLTGTVSEDADFTIDGVQTILADKTFDHKLVLAEGENVFLLVATDAAGNRTEKKIRVLRDTQPPKIYEWIFSSPHTQGGAILTCHVAAEDVGAGLARTGIFEIQVGPNAQIFQGILTHDPNHNRFEGSVFIPPGIKGNVNLRRLNIRDRLGNESVLSKSYD
jgi:hypothetical protein